MNKKILNDLHKVITTLENSKLIREATQLHKVFLRIAQANEGEDWIIDCPNCGKHSYAISFGCASCGHVKAEDVDLMDDIIRKCPKCKKNSCTIFGCRYCHYLIFASDDDDNISCPNCKMLSYASDPYSRIGMNMEPDPELGGYSKNGLFACRNCRFITDEDANALLEHIQKVNNREPEDLLTSLNRDRTLRDLIRMQDQAQIQTQEQMPGRIENFIRNILQYSIGELHQEIIHNDKFRLEICNNISSDEEMNIAAEILLMVGKPEYIDEIIFAFNAFKPGPSKDSAPPPGMFSDWD